MKILIVSSSDNGGGASNGSIRLMDALKAQGHQVWMAVAEKHTQREDVLDFSIKKRTFWQARKKRLASEYWMPLIKEFKTTNKIWHSYNYYSLMDINKINSFDCDVVNLHWIGNNALSIEDIAKIKKPIICTLHDSWFICGAEHYSDLNGDVRYIEGYTKANKPVGTTGPDLCRLVWERKWHYLHKKPIVFTAPSNWEIGIQKESKLFKERLGFVCPNLIDTSIYRKKNKLDCRKALGLPLHATIIGFGAAYEMDERKGGKFLACALKMLEGKGNYHLVLFGPPGAEFVKNISIPSTHMGFINDEEKLATIYNTMDVYVTPSMIESFGFTCLESNSCGVPVVAFNIGGIPDIIKHRYNGYLAEPYKSEDLAKGILEALEHKEEWGENGIQKCHEDFDSKKIVAKYITAYEAAINYKKKH